MSLDSLDPDVVFGSDSVHTPIYSISEHACSDYPNCEWSDDCGGQHSYSPRSDETVEGNFYPANYHSIEGVQSESPVVADLGLPDSSLVVNGVVPECPMVVDRGAPNSPEPPLVVASFVVDSCDDDIDGLMVPDSQFP